MAGMRLLPLLFQKQSLLRIFIWATGLSIFILVDTLGTIYLASRTGAYLAVAIVGISTWVNLAIVLGSLGRHTGKIRKNSKEGVFKQIEYIHVNGLLISSLLMLLPGLVTDLLGWIIFFLPVRLAVGSALYYPNQEAYQEVHQYMSSS